MSGMGQSASKKRRSVHLEETAFLDLLRTADILSRGLAQVLKTEELSATQYNVLRILRGSPDGLPCGEIASRMITRDPDITRLLDRLKKRRLISRCRKSKDRRMVLARITPEGLKLLARLDEPVQEGHRKQLGHLGRERLRALTATAPGAAARSSNFICHLFVATIIVASNLIKKRNTAMIVLAAAPQTASTKINRKDYGLTWNAALETGGILVDEVTITLDVQFIKA